MLAFSFFALAGASGGFGGGSAGVNKEGRCGATSHHGGGSKIRGALVCR